MEFFTQGGHAGLGWRRCRLHWNFLTATPENVFTPNSTMRVPGVSEGEVETKVKMSVRKPNKGQHAKIFAN